VQANLDQNTGDGKIFDTGMAVGQKEVLVYYTGVPSHFDPCAPNHQLSPDLKVDGRPMNE